VRRFYVRRKDFSHFPFQYYITREGVERPLEKGATYTFYFEPPKEQFCFLHVHILDRFALKAEQEWDIPEADLIRIAAKGFEAWLKGEAIPEDHFNGTDLLKVDEAWYPHGPDLTPLLMPNPYRFEVETDDPWPIDVFRLYTETAQPARSNAKIALSETSQGNVRKVVFGFTLDVFPGFLIVGYWQMKHRVMEAGLQVEVKLARLDDLPPGTQILLVPTELAETARLAAPDCRVEVLTELVNVPIYDAVVEELKSGSKEALSLSGAG
jgi:hypothetical protein